MTWERFKNNKDVYNHAFSQNLVKNQMKFSYKLDEIWVIWIRLIFLWMNWGKVRSILIKIVWFQKKFRIFAAKFERDWGCRMVDAEIYCKQLWIHFQTGIEHGRFTGLTCAGPSLECPQTRCRGGNNIWCWIHKMNLQSGAWVLLLSYAEPTVSVQDY